MITAGDRVVVKLPGGDTAFFSLKVRQGAFTADGPGLPFMTCLLPQAEDMLPRSGEQHIAATSTAPGSVVGEILFGEQQFDIHQEGKKRERLSTPLKRDGLATFVL